jgi:hypothetical protein
MCGVRTGAQAPTVGFSLALTGQRLTVPMDHNHSFLPLIPSQCFGLAPVRFFLGD